MDNSSDYLKVTRGSREGQQISLAGLPLAMGRMQASDAVFEDDGVSRLHARVSKGPDGYVIEDLGSSNGTFVNDARIQGPCPIANGDHIRLGPDVELVAVIEAREAEGAQDEPLAAGALEPREDDAGGKTMIGSIADLGLTNQVAAIKEASPPRLIVRESGHEPVEYELTAARVRIGRLSDNDVVVENHYVSRYHAELQKQGDGYVLAPLPNISNTLLLDGQPVMEPMPLHNGAKLRLGGYSPGEMVTMDYVVPAEEVGPGVQQITEFAENRVVTIGRGADNNIVLPSPLVSRYHAEVEKIGTRYRLRDLRSSNGTFVNGQTVTGDTWVHPGDAIQIGPHRFVVAENQFHQFDQSEGGVRVEAFGLNKWVSKDLNILQNISLTFQPREFIVVVGQSGGGKSTLVDAIAGYRPATHGKVIVNGSIDVYKEFNAIRSTIGYVPQRDIIHMELTVFEALDYSARLRMPPDTTREERKKRVEEVMQELDLAHRRDTVVNRLSGGQQKRVSIGVELLTKPGLFFLDEPTSGLDPGTETELMRLMRRLADQGRTIVMITHATKNVMLADKVVFLARGGYLAWFGPPEEALAYFDQYRSEKDRRSSPMEFDHIYTLLDRDELGSGADWDKRFREHPAYGEYVAEPLKLPEPGAEGTKKEKAAAADGQAAVASKKPARRRQISSTRQFSILSSRNLRIITRDRFGLILLLATAPLLACLDFFIANGTGHDPFSFQNGNFNNVIVTMVVIINTTLLVGGLSTMRELVKERDIYKRERMVNLRLMPYLLSKVWISALLAFYMAFCFTAVRYLAFKMPGGTQEMIFYYFTVFMLVLSGMMLGFFASALAPNSNTAPLLLLMFVIPQLILSGTLVPLPAIIRLPASSSWAFWSGVAISGAGSDVAADACWNLPEADQKKLTLDQKNAKCTCMGENALRQSSCDFPGMGQYYDSALDTTDPSQPVAPGPQPTEPVLPPTPAPPQNPTDPASAVKYLAALNTFNTTAAPLQTQYKQQISDWQKQQQDYANQLTDYQKTLGDLQMRRAIAVGSAEATIRRFKDDYGWTFVNKNDPKAYPAVLFKAWGVQFLIIVVLFVGTAILQRQRDVV